MILEGFRKKNSEIIISGRVLSGRGLSAFGRVKFFDESYTEGSILCVRGGDALDRDALLLCPPIAVALFSDGINDLNEILSLGVPCLLLDGLSESCEQFKGRAALVDAERGVMMLDPSIDTLELYSAKSKKQLLASEITVGEIIKDVNSSKNRFLRAEYCVADASLLNGDALDLAVRLWERSCPELLIFDASAPTDDEKSERAFFELAESIYRAALYGSIAISVSDFDGDRELLSAMRILHKAFCVLEAEGREFNAYLPRGITVSSPIWLMKKSPVENPDFLIFNLDALLTSLFSTSADNIIKKEKALKKELLTIFERYFSSFAPRCDIYLRTECFSNTSLLRDLARLSKAKAVFCRS